MSDESVARPVTLEMIEKHLNRIERDAIGAAFLHPIALAVTLIISGIAIIWADSAGIGFLILGAIYLFYIIYRYVKFSRQGKL